ncbi:MAG: ATP-dependent sacrificial sulfur transferase LarE [Planctomycetota bacterium]|nr:ATP-dependent sacrificial sulfur transferase LarE [Planctomycetota bacterium]
MSSNTERVSTQTTEELVLALNRWFHELPRRERIVVALSGGVDSSVVIRAASLSSHSVLAVTSSSEAVAARELVDAKQVAEKAGVEHLCMHTNELAVEEYVRNDARRCYFCKRNLFSTIIQSLELRSKSFWLLSGTNADDLGDYRPGLQAAEEHAVRAPLAELGITKIQVRQLAQYWQLPVSSKPASPCLASRIAYGVEVTRERLVMIEAAESFLLQQGFSDCRVRVHEGDLARVEVPIGEVSRLCAPKMRENLSRQLKQLGFVFVTIDLDGLRSGGLNQLIQIGVYNRR